MQSLCFVGIIRSGGFMVFAPGGSLNFSGSHLLEFFVALVDLTFWRRIAVLLIHIRLAYSHMDEAHL